MTAADFAAESTSARSAARTSMSLAVEAALTAEHRHAILRQFREGMHVADVLDQAHDADLLLDVTEPWHEQHSGVLRTRLGAPLTTPMLADYRTALDAYRRLYAGVYALLARALLDRPDLPDVDVVIGLAQDALAGVQRD